MFAKKTFLAGLTAVFCGLSGHAHGNLDIAQQPLFQPASYPPLNMLVMGKDHTLFYEAYNDTSDLTGDDQPDVGYKPDEIDYYGYFDSFKCYSYGDNRFTPVSTTSTKQCNGSWSGDFLNWVTTSRIDALRKVLYGGSRSTDTDSTTILERSYIPQDAHSWGKEYRSVARDGYDISNYTPLSQPSAGNYHVLANTSLTGSPERPRMRVLKNSEFRVWEWLSIERPVAGSQCDDGNRRSCTSGTGTMEDFTVRVEVCKPGLLESNCTQYPDGNHKPTGLLQQYGENSRMLFGLISGSYANNTEGGVLRKPAGSLDDEIDLDDGTFTDTNGIIRTIDQFKIDRSFIQDLDEHSESEAIVMAIIRLAKSLGLSTVAEGVETESQREYLAQAGCDLAQGFLYSRPLPANEFAQWRKERLDRQASRK